jgi:hypothetical protein
MWSNVTRTPRIHFLLDWEFLSRCGEPHCVLCSYDKGAKTTFDDKQPIGAFGDVSPASGSIATRTSLLALSSYQLLAAIFLELAQLRPNGLLHDLP